MYEWQQCWMAVFKKGNIHTTQTDMAKFLETKWIQYNLQHLCECGGLQIFWAN